MKDFAPTGIGQETFFGASKLPKTLNFLDFHFAKREKPAY